MTDTITLIATIPAILALVNLAKSFGITGRWATLLAVILGVVLHVVDYAFLSLEQSPSGWYGAVGTGLVLGLSAAGLYDVARTASPSVGVGPTIITERATDPVDIETATAVALMDEMDGITTVPERAAIED